MEDRCICCGDIIPEGIQVCRTCEEKVNNMNKEGYRDDTAEQAIWGVRKEERIRFLEEKHGEGIQVCRTCEEKVNNMNKEGYRDDTAEQAIWGVRKEERIRFLEEKHGVYRGEKYRLLLDREPSDARTEKLIPKMDDGGN